MSLVILKPRCPMCGAINTMVVNEANYQKWQNGALTQDAFPYLDADEREMLISGICSDCWNKMFSEDEEEDEEEEEDWEDPFDLDFGFNPYAGCYDYDC